MFTQVNMRQENVAVQVIEKKDEKVGSIILTSKNSNAAEPPTALVVSIGPEVKYVKVGDKVLITSRVGHDLLVDGKKLVILEEKEILAIVEE